MKMPFSLAVTPEEFMPAASFAAELPLIEDDPLVALLQQAAESELDGLVACLVEKGGITCQLRRLPIYAAKYPRHRAYVKDVAAELQKFGANTIASVFRSGKGVAYGEIVQDVAGRLGVRRSGTAAEVEQCILQKLAEKYWEGSSIGQRTALLEQFGVIDHNLLTSPVIPAALITAVHVSGFAAYQFTVIVANAVAHALLGHGLSFAVNAALTKGVSIFAGPPGWCLVAFLTANMFASESYRVTVPAVVQVALIRSAIEARREQEAIKRQGTRRVLLTVTISLAAVLIVAAALWLVPLL
jgi:uncharacterized protein YaaW (UPF0174 family)